jgi:uncharacterized SAM-binding protein YcdF (DUF218 family)
MLYLAGKVTQAIIAPMHVVFVLLIFGWLIRRRQPRASGIILFLAIALLYLSSAPWSSRLLLGTLEGKYPIRPSTELPEADAIVLLGGTTYPVQPPRVEAEEITGARVQRAARLYRAGKAPKIIVSGGVVYSSTEGLARTEADDMFDLLVMMGVPADAIVREAASRNTYENTGNTLGILEAMKCRQILLVTSAFHMPRAMALFRRSNLTIIPAPSDPRSGGKANQWRDFFPGPDALKLTTQAVNEIVGIGGYWLLGKL